MNTSFLKNGKNQYGFDVASELVSLSLVKKTPNFSTSYIAILFPGFVTYDK